MLTLRRKLTGALGGGGPSSSSASSSYLSTSPHDALPAALVITASPPPPLFPPPPSSHKSPSLSMSMIGSPRAAAPAMQSSPLHQHQPLAPRRASVAWVPDSLADKCYACTTHYTLLVRRHHCRRCGNVFCDACSQSRIPLVAAGFLTPVRVCDKCCVAAKKAHARLVVDRQQQWLDEQALHKDKRNRLRPMHSDESIAYEENESDRAPLFPPPRAASTTTTTTTSTSHRVTQPTANSRYTQSRQYIRSQTVKQLYSPLIAASSGGAKSRHIVKQFFADPYGDVEEDEEERRSFERRTGLGGGGASDVSNEVSVQTLPGEVLLVRSENVRCRLMNQLTETDGTLYVTSYRLVFSPTIDIVPEYDQDTVTLSHVHQAIPLGTIERLKRKEMAETDTGLLALVTKDFRHVQFFFKGLVAKQTFNQFDRTVYTIRQYAFGEPVPAAEPFLRATALAAAADKPSSSSRYDGWRVYDAAAEFHRMGVGSDAATATPRWRLTSVNEDFGLCPTYPSLLAVPSSVGDQVLTVAAKYRSKARIPVLSWRNPCTGAVICRSSQPLVGLGQRQCDKDVFLIQAISVANPSSSKFVIIDARPWKNAVAQKTVGSAGYELTEKYETRHSSATSKFADMAASSTDFGGGVTSSMMPSPPTSARTTELSYDEDDDTISSVSDRIFRQMDASSVDPSLILTECKLIFMGIENIHIMRKSYAKVLDLCIHKPTDKWVEHLGASRWIEHISKVLDSAVEIVRIVNDEKSSVLVHCSDGWDRTPQLTSLAQLMMDPYYRTLEGFQVLIEKEWCSFGHKFGDRSAHGVNPTTSNDISPVFLQFIDCVWQIYRQFPCAFEFNEQFLMLVLDHLYSCRFGTFMFDSEKERRDREAQRTTISLWTYIASLERTEITNAFYVAPRKLNAVSISQAGGLLSPGRDERDERDEDERRDSALRLFPSARENGAPSDPIKIPPQSDGSTEGSTTPLDGLARSPLLSPSKALPRTASDGSRQGFFASSPERIPGLMEETEDDEVLRPCAWSRALQFWTRYYLRWDPSTLTDRVGTVWIETAHRELQDRLDEAERQLAARSDSSSDQGSGVNLPELVQFAAKSLGEEGRVTATVPFDVIEKLETLEQRKRDALAQIEKQFEDDAARLLQPTLELERPMTAGL